MNENHMKTSVTTGEVSLRWAKKADQRAKSSENGPISPNCYLLGLRRRLDYGPRRQKYHENDGNNHLKTVNTRSNGKSRLKQANLDQTKKGGRKISDDTLLADLKLVAEQIKKSVTIEEYNERGQFGSTTLIRHFGSWFKALELACLPKTRNLRISNEELFSNLIDIWTKFGQQPHYNDLTSQTSKYSSATYEKRFGTWRKALEAFVVWANEGKAQAIEVPPQKEKVLQKPNGAQSKAKPLPKQGIFRHRTSRTINHRLRFLVMRRDNFKCKITGRSPATDQTVILEVDHIVPWDKGGETVMENLQTLAKDINIGKSNLDMYQEKGDKSN